MKNVLAHFRPVRVIIDMSYIMQKTNSSHHKKTSSKKQNFAVIWLVSLCLILSSNSSTSYANSADRRIAAGDSTMEAVPLNEAAKAAGNPAADTTAPLNAGHGGSNAARPDLSMLSLFWQADLVVKGVMLLLLLASVYSWAIITNRVITFRGVRRKMEAFEKVFWSGQPLDTIFKKLSTDPDPAPSAAILIAAMEEFHMKNEQRPAKNTKDRLGNAMTIALNRALNRLQEGFAGLATTASISPFVGLFGTVWGIMTTFPSIATSKNVTIATIAPGMAEALLATAFGLVAAIPAGIFYTKFSADIQKIEAKTDEFRIELINIMLRDLDE